MQESRCTRGPHDHSSSFTPDTAPEPYCRVEGFSTRHCNFQWWIMALPLSGPVPQIPFLSLEQLLGAYVPTPDRTSPRQVSSLPSPEDSAPSGWHLSRTPYDPRPELVLPPREFTSCWHYDKNAVRSDLPRIQLIPVSAQSLNQKQG